MKKKATISPRKAPLQKRSQGLVETIVTATARVLTRQGYEHATTNKVAEAAGVSIGSLYQYFPNKEALIGAVIDRTVQANTERIEAELARSPHLTLDEKMAMLVRLGFETYNKNRALFRIMFEQAPRLERVQNIFRARRHLGRTLIAALEGHGIRPENPELAAYVLLNGALGVIQAAVFDVPESTSNDELIAEITRLVRGYLKELTAG
jgi:AcrR family transcriptional regulator